jgi:hypothetical protein
VIAKTKDYGKSSCGPNGYLISKPYAENVLPIFDSCARRTAAPLGVSDFRSPLVMTHLGIVSDRDIARAKGTRSLHAAGRAVDIAQFKFGDTVFSYLPDYTARDSSDTSNWKRFWKPFKECLKGWPEVFLWPIDAESELEVILDNDVLTSVEDYLAPALPNDFPGYEDYMKTVDDNGNSSASHPDWSKAEHKMRQVALDLGPVISASASPLAAKRNPDLKKTLLESIKREFDFTPSDASITDFIAHDLEIGPILHRDHLHVSYPFTTEEQKQPMPDGVTPTHQPEEGEPYYIDGKPTRYELLEVYAQG